jgi:hypothetical protein
MVENIIDRVDKVGGWMPTKGYFYLMLLAIEEHEKGLTSDVFYALVKDR